MIKIRFQPEKMVPIDEIVPHPKNRNAHPKDQIERLADILRAQGWRYPIKISNQSGFITSGHGRLEAAKLLGMKEVPVSFQDYEDEALEYQDLIADNAIASWSELDFSGINSDIGDLGPDFNIDLLGIKNFKIDVAEKELGDPDAIPDKAETRVKKGEVWILGDHRLMCGDSTMVDDIGRLMGEVVAELCFTSPPYSDQREYGVSGLDLSTKHLATFIRAAYKKARYFAVNLGYSRKDGEVFQYWNDYLDEAKSCGLKLLSWNVWNKGECGSIGNQTAMFGISHEWIFVFGEKTKEINKTVLNRSAGHLSNHSSTRQKDGSLKKEKTRIVSDLSQLKTVYDCVPQKSRDDIDHPARFPVDFPSGYIEAMTNEKDFVYDPFGGSGTTLIACEKLNRVSLSMEIDPKYCDIILARWEKYTGKTAVLD